mgnify:FL=1
MKNEHAICCDREHLVVLALAGVLSEEQTAEVRASVRFVGGNTMDLAYQRQVLNGLADAARRRREDPTGDPHEP